MTSMRQNNEMVTDARKMHLKYFESQILLAAESKKRPKKARQRENFCVIEHVARLAELHKPFCIIID